jgi:hypothetical protein
VSFFTPTLWAVAPDGFACNLTNVGHKPRSVKVRIINDGNILLDSGEIALARRYTVDQFVEGLPDEGPIYCEYTVEGSEKEHRGAAKLFHLPNSSDFAVIAAQ